ncbi:hypothetical protein C2S51_009516 [Perilla frutescens var. frutescens]|nr:hypothetical protein C2S51_009516 [Perilla frutescens var. frutescens]
MFSMKQNNSNGKDNSHGVSEKNAYIDGIMAEAEDDAYIDEIMAEAEHDEARNIREKVMADLLGSYTEEYKRLHDYVKEINVSNPGNGIVEDVLRYNIESFSKVYFRTTPKCDAVDNNMAEAFNGWILEAREWDLTGILCQHVISTLYSAGLEPQNFVVHWYAEPTYLKAYQYMLQPVRGKILWDESGKEEIAPPPPHKKLPGRPKVNRKKDKNEIKKMSKLSRKGRVMNCKMCNQSGHNATEVNRESMKKKVIKMNESKRGNSSAKLVREFTKVKRGSTSQGRAKASSSQVPRASNQSSQLKRPVNEVREEISCYGHNQYNQSSKRNRKTIKFGPRKLPTGYGRYVNEHTGQAILNPGTRYMKSFDKAHQAVVYSSEPQPVQDVSKDVPENENRTISSLKWKEKATMTTRQLLVEAQRKITAVTTQSKERK